MEIIIFAVGLVTGFIMGFVPTWAGQHIYRKQLEALSDGKEEEDQYMMRIVPETEEDPDDIAEREKKERDTIGFW